MDWALPFFKIQADTPFGSASKHLNSQITGVHSCSLLDKELRTSLLLAPDRVADALFPGIELLGKIFLSIIF